MVRATPKSVGTAATRFYESVVLKLPTYIALAFKQELRG